MGVYTLNICVDMPDAHPRQIPEDLSLNDQESIVEIVVEQILGYENTIKEHDDPDTEETQNKKNIKVDILLAFRGVGAMHHPSAVKNLWSQSANILATKGYRTIEIPPPNS